MRAYSFGQGSRPHARDALRFVRAGSLGMLVREYFGGSSGAEAALTALERRYTTMTRPCSTCRARRTSCCAS